MRQLAKNSENNTSMFLKEELTVPRPRRSMIFHRKQNAFDSDLRPFGNETIHTPNGVKSTLKSRKSPSHHLGDA